MVAWILSCSMELYLVIHPASIFHGINTAVFHGTVLWKTGRLKVTGGHCIKPLASMTNLHIIEYCLCLKSKNPHLNLQVRWNFYMATPNKKFYL